MTKTVSIGRQNFEELISSNCFYVDKTDLIREWWDSQDDITLITRPRRFGKTLNMDMLKCFFSDQYAGRADLFRGLKIWESEEYRRIQGTFPVIFLSFADVKQTNYEDAVKKIKRILTDLYQKYIFLASWEGLTDVERSQFLSVTPEMDDVTAQCSLLDLSNYLSRYHGKKVILLLDEYDTPLQEAYTYGYGDRFTAFIRSLFHSAFKTNPYLERALMTGITRVSKESIFSDLNNLNVITTTSEQYADCFGFTEQEVLEALAAFGLEDTEEEVRRWYDGFAFGSCRNIYNPWSITNYLDKRKFGAYWASTSSNRLISSLLKTAPPKIKELMEDLLNNREIVVSFDEQLVFEQLDQDENAIWSLLVASGYLRVERTEYRGMLREPWYHLLITNLETAGMFSSMFQGWFSSTASACSAFIRALLRGDIREMNAYMNEVALATFSSFDSGTHPSENTQPERFYHGFLLGMLVELRDRYEVRSNRESGYGRYDVMLLPRSLRGNAVIIEFKVRTPPEEKTLEDTVQAALEQIRRKKYTAELLDRGFPPEQIRCYGFAFEGKQVLIGRE